ncbi:NAD(P)-binding domain-containing protein [Echinicola sp. CAU 1574]|uniref:NAD(P)-binding domain-containing protein n=1 Tax=Echinicola arenosa TaxID=2774144 RepID=A0ABR9AS92_9BACT|nr:NAD(P)-binding domain-containing protein [Echinicola arenosa]MBD8490743.1 NAD(P)-binding domain-containing protein [Echinicola arenosa]
MRIGIIGAGLMGKTLAQKLSKKGHQIVIANSRGPHTIDVADRTGIKAVKLQDAVVNVDAVILCIPFGKIPELPKDLFSQLETVIPVIDITNYFPSRHGVIEELENGKVHSVWVEEQIGRPVVKTFSTIIAHSFVTGGLPKGTPERIALTVSGDGKNGVETAMQLVEDTGFDAFDAGSIVESWRQQPGNPAYCTDLTLEELKPALAKADAEKALVTKKLVI